MIRAVWDTNVLASAAIARHGVLAELIELWRNGDIAVVVSAQIVAELESTLRKPYFLARLTDAQRDRFHALVQRFSLIVEVTAPIPSVLSQRADNVVLATAISAQAPYIVTGDREVRNLGTFQLVSLSTPGG